jgi:hypothetical protein
MKFIKLPSVEFLNKSLSYNPDTGNIFRLTGRYKGAIAGAVSVKGRHVIDLVIDGKTVKFYSARIAWKIFYKEEPTSQIDHINGDKLDNRICNLRAATNSENQCNTSKRDNSRPYKGVFKRRNAKGKHYKDWTYQIRFDYKLYQVSGFATAEEAFEARCAFGKQLHGDFYNAGGVSSL